MKNFVFLATALLLMPAVHGQAAPIKYKLSSANNTNGGMLDLGYFTTDGVIGENIRLVFGETLINYELHISQGSATAFLTPENSRVFSGEVLFDISANEITIDNSPFANFPRDIFQIRHNSNRSADGFLMIWHEDDTRGVGGIGIFAGTRDGSLGRLQPKPYLVATVVPEPATMLLSLMGVLGCVAIRRR